MTVVFVESSFSTFPVTSAPSYALIAGPKQNDKKMGPQPSLG